MEQPTNNQQCTHCGFSNQPGSLYCSRCGQWLSSWRPIQTIEPIPPPPVEARQAVPLPPATTPRTNSLAVAGFISGLAGFFIFGVALGPLAVVLGVVALSQIRKSGDSHSGKGFAIAAIVVGALAFFGALAVLIWYIPLQLLGFSL
ncbi:MAG: DUF4190 domain-containing protein [Coprothermobacterota bacterium]|nr:DUF4190 domain-containing protein [Coprothermobacterota bacterium]